MIALFTGPVVGASAPDAGLLRWANSSTQQYASAFKGPETMVVVSDHFGGIGSGGMRIATPGTGSRWYYDRVHHIAAMTSGQDDFLAYAAEPPVLLPGKDLSRVRSMRGIHLGSTVAEVIAVFRVPVRAVMSRPGGIQTLELFQPNPPKSSRDSFSGSVVFRNGRAVQVELGISPG